MWVKQDHSALDSLNENIIVHRFTSVLMIFIFMNYYYHIFFHGKQKKLSISGEIKNKGRGLGESRGRCNKY